MKMSAGVYRPGLRYMERELTRCWGADNHTVTARQLCRERRKLAMCQMCKGLPRHSQIRPWAMLRRGRQPRHRKRQDSRAQIPTLLMPGNSRLAPDNNHLTWGNSRRRRTQHTIHSLSRISILRMANSMHSMLNTHIICIALRQSRAKWQVAHPLVMPV